MEYLATKNDIEDVKTQVEDTKAQLEAIKTQLEAMKVSFWRGALFIIVATSSLILVLDTLISRIFG